jgi:hypothetical protein
VALALRRLLLEADLTKLRDLLRAEAMRIAMIRYSWNAATAAEHVDIKGEELANLSKPLNGTQNMQRDTVVARRGV